MSAVLTLAAGLLAGMAFMAAVARVVPRPTRLIAMVIAVPAGAYALAGLPWWTTTVGAFLLAGFVVLEKAGFARSRSSDVVGRLAQRLAAAGAGRPTRVASGVARWVLTRRRSWAEAVTGIGLEALAGSCESCGRGPASTEVRFPDGAVFQVCASCAASSFAGLSAARLSSRGAS